ncbi:MAG: DUF4126 domain-containing protein [Steroidobacteraceae bacterium]
MPGPEILLAAALGIALAAAVGLRVFVPVLALSLAAWSGRLELAPAFAWLASGAAVVTFSIAAALEIGAYYIPGIDHLLDVLLSPVALVAGTLMVVAPLWELPPLVKWSAGIVAGGGAAGATQLLSSLLRAKSALGTGGLANPVVATGELGGSLLLSLLALLLPFIALAVVAALVLVLLRWLWRRARTARATPPPGPAPT